MVRVRMDDRDADIDQGESSAPRDQRIRIGTESVDNEDRASLSSLPPSNKAQDNDASELHARSHSTFFVPSKRSATFLKGILGQRRPKDQVFLNSLKVNAEEVKETRTFERRFNVFKGPLSSYNSIRETYRLIRESERESRLRNTWQRVVHLAVVMARKLWILIRALLSSDQLIVTMSFLDMLVEASFCILYLVEFAVNVGIDGNYAAPEWVPIWLHVYRYRALFQAAIVFSYWNVVAFVVRVFYSTDRLRTVFSVTSLLDLVICVPIIALSNVEGGIFVYVPYYLRMLALVFCVSDVIRMRRSWSIVMFDSATERLVVLASYMAALLYIAICTFHYSEFYFGQSTEDLTLMQCFYFIIITVSTVGYGEITPTTVAGQWVVIFTIFIAISFLPGLISAIVETIQLTSAGGGSFKRRKAGPYVIVCGRFVRASQLVDVLNEFYWRHTSKKAIRIVILSPTPATQSIKSVIDQKLYRNMITYVYGSPLSERSLERVKLQWASAAFLVPARNPHDTAEEADKITLRSLAFDNYAPNTPLFVYNILPDSYSLQEKITDAAICLDSLKQMLLAYNCIYRGTATIVINLLRQTSARDAYDEPWQSQYGDGVGSKIFTSKMNPLFIKRTFSAVAYFLFNEFQVILFAVSTKLKDGSPHLLLNPGKSYILKSDDELQYIAQSDKDISRIRNMAPEKLSNSSTNLNTLGVSSPREIFLPSMESPHSFLDEEIVLDTPKSTSRLMRQLPVCKLKKFAAVLKDLIITDATNWSDHILVCTKSFDVFEFMCTLRSAQISTVEYKKVLFLSVEDPTEGNAAQILQFPGIGFLKGDPRKKRDLLRAGINNADKVVLINLRNSMSEVGEDDVSLEYLDSNTIVVSHLIHSMFRGRAKKYVVNDLQEKENIKFLRPTILKHSKKAIVKEEGTINTSRRAFTEDSYTYTPIFAGGRVIASSMLGSILYQTYYNPLIVKTFEYFCGVRRSGDIIVDEQLGVGSPTLCYVSVPEPYIGRTFGALFNVMTLKLGLLPIGIFRDEISDELGNILPFVYTNPLPSLVLRSTDLVYVLATDSQLAQ